MRHQRDANRRGVRILRNKSKGLGLDLTGGKGGVAVGGGGRVAVVVVGGGVVIGGGTSIWGLVFSEGVRERAEKVVYFG